MIYKNNNKIKAIYYGTTPIAKIYKGTDLVFKKALGTILTLNDYVPFQDVKIPSGSTFKEKNVTGTKTYKWDKALEPGTYTFRFNYQTGMGAGLGEKKDTATLDVTSDYQKAFYWQEGTNLVTSIYINTTGFKVEYLYWSRSLDNVSWPYKVVSNQYITTVEII